MRMWSCHENSPGRCTLSVNSRVQTDKHHQLWARRPPALPWGREAPCLRLALGYGRGTFFKDSSLIKFFFF